MEHRAITGTSDVLPNQSARWLVIERAFRDLVGQHAYDEIRTPIIEPTPLFLRSIGVATDIVEKEMYSFLHHGDAITLRPEGTASAVRAYVQHHINQTEPVSRWYYVGPMFRGERPARGRYRQFHQLGCELFGDPGPACDAEMIDMLQVFFASLGIPNIDIVVNSLGSRDTRDRYSRVLVDHLAPRKDDLSEDSRRRLLSNPLRILDSKDERDIAALVGVPSVLDVVDAGDRAHFDSLRRYLDRLGTPYRVDPTLVRGLDYYTRTLFEIRCDAGSIGAQNALGGGGRYDTLVSQLGGTDTPAIGFALGVERILLAMESVEAGQELSSLVAVLPLGEAAAGEALVLARELRARGLRVDVDCRGGSGASVKSMLRRANARSVRVCLVLGDSELANQQVQLKDLLARSQETVARRDVVDCVLRLVDRAVSAGGVG